MYASGAHPAFSTASILVQYVVMLTPPVFFPLLSIIFPRAL